MATLESKIVGVGFFQRFCSRLNKSRIRSSAERQQTNAFDDERVARSALARWKARMVQLKVSDDSALMEQFLIVGWQSLAKRAHAIVVDRDANIQRLAFNAWLASHNSKVVVEVRKERQLRSMLDTWKNRMDSIVEQHRTFLIKIRQHSLTACSPQAKHWHLMIHTS